MSSSSLPFYFLQGTLIYPSLFLCFVSYNCEANGLSLMLWLKSVWRPRLALLHVKCLSNIPDKDAILESQENEIEDKSSLSNSLSSSISAYNWCAGLGGLGFLETGYLTFLKFTNSDVFCPLGSSSTSCNTILNSHYSLLFGTLPYYYNCVFKGFVLLIDIISHGW